MLKPNPLAAITVLTAALLAFPPGALAASHREAPITALDHKADITDFFAFVSYDKPDKVTFILNVDPLLEPANGPNYFPFDPNVLYTVKIDNNHDAIEDVWFELRFTTEIRAPNVFTGFVGAGSGIPAPDNSPPPVAPGTPIVPPAITALDGPGSEGLSLRQRYTVTLARRGPGNSVKRTRLGEHMPLFALPSNVGPRTMPDYPSLFKQALYQVGHDIRVFAGTVEDPFWIDLGAAFDSLNFRATGFTVPGVLSDAQDADDTRNFATDAVSGYNVNAIAIEVPVSLLTSDGKKHAASDPKATIGAWGTTSRQRVFVRRQPAEARDAHADEVWRQVQRMGNPLINELLVGTGSKDRFSVDQPRNDSRFAPFFLDPLLARVFNAIYRIDIPTPPRTDLLPLVTYAPPIAAAGTPAGPVADLLRLNTGVPPTPVGKQKRLGLLAGDPAGFPNGRRLGDDVTDISARAVAGVLNPLFNKAPNNRIGDGVNVNDAPYKNTFPYLGFAWDGRNRRHLDPGEVGGGPVN
ncbi:DUF4331 domain-containing protein [Archangium violaceum]|uniref:DUF4331 domain-containing protein n=1 Tax=Archangium violaceum TaxID=83451 RepID=UPI00194F1312|nr:DUF4331 domain-containing protein [Archangium violaceum]QRN92776.1 DUF4331 domain-containing protein [Archangium violaceum]